MSPTTTTCLRSSLCKPKMPDIAFAWMGGVGCERQYCFGSSLPRGGSVLGVCCLTIFKFSRRSTSPLHRRTETARRDPGRGGLPPSSGHLICPRRDSVFCAFSGQQVAITRRGRSQVLVLQTGSEARTPVELRLRSCRLQALRVPYLRQFTAWYGWILVRTIRAALARCGTPVAMRHVYPRSPAAKLIGGGMHSTAKQKMQRQQKDIVVRVHTPACGRTHDCINRI